MHLRAHREPNEVGADTEASTLASRHADAGADNVEDREDRRRDNAEREDLLDRQGLLRDEDRRDRDEKTLDKILDRTIDYLRSEVHWILYCV